MAFLANILVPIAGRMYLRSMAAYPLYVFTRTLGLTAVFNQ